MALLAAYCIEGRGTSLADFLDDRVFADAEGSRMDPVESEVKGFRAYLDRFIKGLPLESAAIEFS